MRRLNIHIHTHIYEEIKPDEKKFLEKNSVLYPPKYLLVLVNRKYRTVDRNIQDGS